MAVTSASGRLGGLIALGPPGRFTTPGVAKSVPPRPNVSHPAILVKLKI